MLIRKHVIFSLLLCHFTVHLVQYQENINVLMLPELTKPTTKIINIPYILKVINTINYLKTFESYIVVSLSLTDFEEDKEMSLFKEEMKPRILIHNEQFNGTDMLRSSRALNSNSIITIVFAKSSRDSALNKVSVILRNFKLSVVMVVITTAFARKEDIESMVFQTLNTLSNAKIVNSMVIYDDNVFKFELYPTFEVFNLTGEEYSMNLNAERNINFKGYHIRTPIKSDNPRVFTFTGPDNTKKVRGITGCDFCIKYTFGS